MFNNYCYQKGWLQNFCFFVYVYVISIYSRKLTNSNDIEFKSNHPRHQTHVQQNFTKPGCQAEVTLLKPLFDSDGLGNIISTDDFRSVKGYNNINVI